METFCVCLYYVSSVDLLRHASSGVPPILTELYNRPSSLMARYRAVSTPWMTTTPLPTAVSFKTAEKSPGLGVFMWMDRGPQVFKIKTLAEKWSPRSCNGTKSSQKSIVTVITKIGAHLTGWTHKAKCKRTKILLSSAKCLMNRLNVHIHSLSFVSGLWEKAGAHAVNPCRLHTQTQAHTMLWFLWHDLTNIF